MKQPINDLKSRIVMKRLESMPRRELELLAFEMFLKLSCYYQVTGYMDVEVDREEVQGIPLELLEQSKEAFDGFVDHVAETFSKTQEGN